MKTVAGRLRLDLAQYRELATFAQFGTSDLDASTRAQLERGQRAVEVLKQVQDAPLALENQVTILYALVNGLLDDVELAKVSDFEKGLGGFMAASHPETLKGIADVKALTDELQASLTKAIEEFKATVPY
jgi:F-type H+-transporting ATPase subunit alpha